MDRQVVEEEIEYLMGKAADLRRLANSYYTSISPALERASLDLERRADELAERASAALPGAARSAR